MNKYKRQSQAGFTLVEILIVVILIGLLGTVMLAGSFMPTLLRSRDTRRKHDLAEIATALEAYVNDHGTYPLSDASGRIVGCEVSGVMQACSWDGSFKSDTGTVYMAKLPGDNKQPTWQYRYLAGGSGKAWKLFARIENDKDPVVDTNGDGTADVDYGMKCGTQGNCNYGISSSNVTMVTDLTGY